MSKFFHEDESDHEDDQQQQGEEEAPIQQKEKGVDARKKIIEDMFDSDDDRDRVVITEKEKRFNKLREIVKQIKLKFKNSDFSGLLDNFEELNKEIEKGSKLFDIEGVPRLYIRVVCQIENFILSLSSEQKKKLGANNNKSYNILKSRVKKNNEKYRERIQAFISNPVGTDQSDQEGRKHKKQPEVVAVASSESEADDNDDLELLKSTDPLVRRRYWLKKVVKVKQEDDEKEEKEEKEGKKQGPKQEIDYDVKFKTTQFQDMVIDYSTDAVNRQLERIVSSRGVAKDQLENIFICEKFIQHFINLNLKKTLEILIITVTLQIEQAKRENSIYLSRQAWLQIYQNVQLLYSLYKEKGVKIDVLNTYTKYESDHVFNEQRFLNTLLLHFQTLEAELNKAFLYVDFYLQEYAERLSDLYQLIHLSQRLLEIFKAKDDNVNVAKLSFKQLEGIYFFSPQLIAKLLEISYSKNNAAPIEIFGKQDILDRIKGLVANIYKGGDDELIIQSNLYWTYSLSLHGKFHEAYEIFLQTISYDQVSQMKPQIQLHYNRALIQLGLAAFRLGLINETHYLLADLMTRDKVLKDLLSQNYARQADNEARTNIPYYLSINVEVVEFVYLIAAMLLEVPNIRADPYDEGHRTISRKFRQLCSYYDAQAFNGQPENMRDLLYAASKELGKGEWKKCFDLLLQMSIWQKIPNAEEVQQLLLQRVKEQALKCYLFTFHSQFTNVSITHLQEKFQLPQQQIEQIIYKLIHAGEVEAAVEVGEQPYIIFTNDDFSQSKRIAQILIDKLNHLCKVNEKIMDAKVGSFGFEQDKEVKKRLPTNKNKPKPVPPQNKKKS